MKVVRQIVYESESQDVLDEQLSRSLPDGVRQGLSKGKGMMTIRTLHDERVKVDEFPEETAKAITVTNTVNAGLPPCMCDNCVKVRARRESTSIVTDPESHGTMEELFVPDGEQPEYRPTLLDESETTQGAN